MYQGKRVIGIVAEFNPFHEGHAYLLREARARFGAEYVVIVMSGDFVQRGEPAIFSKYDRVRTALEGGADLVLQLPVMFSTAAAEDFAAAAVAVLARTGICDGLLFGSEGADLRLLQRTADFLAEERQCPADAVPENAQLRRFRLQLRQLQAAGQSYPKARSMALSEVLEIPEDFLPNDVLGIEYLKAIRQQKLSMTPCLIRRDPTLRSAHSIRREMLAAREQKGDLRGQYRRLDDFSDMLSYQLLRLQRAGTALTDFQDVSTELACAIARQCRERHSVTERIALLKTKNLTHARISRALLHILLEIRREDCERAKNRGFVSCLRVLGVSRPGRELLSVLPDPLMISPARTLKQRPILAEDPSLKADFFASALWEQFSDQPHNDFAEKLIVL